MRSLCQDLSRRLAGARAQLGLRQGEVEHGALLRADEEIRPAVQAQPHRQRRRSVEAVGELQAKASPPVLLLLLDCLLLPHPLLVFLERRQFLLLFRVRQNLASYERRVRTRQRTSRQIVVIQHPQPNEAVVAAAAQNSHARHEHEIPNAFVVCQNAVGQVLLT
eukprot:scaffold908_cov228-Pinguiococcus_pyrenoidosus.AAC.3